MQEGNIDEKIYGTQKQNEFLQIYDRLSKKHKIPSLRVKGDRFLDIWFLSPIRTEIDFVFKQIKKLPDDSNKRALALILSRTMRSCRATTHADLGTLKEPVTRPYYCKKHGKVCKPLLSIRYWWRRYCLDTVARLKEFDSKRSATRQICLIGDSRSIDLKATLQKKDKALASLLQKQKIAGIFSSPPYVGLIDYHEQHAYAYDLFNFERHDELEIGPLCKGQSLQAQKDYIQGIAASLRNCKLYLRDDYNVLLVANDKYNLYPDIASEAGMQIVNEYKRPVLNRVEKDRSAYAEKIFHMREKN